MVFSPNQKILLLSSQDGYVTLLTYPKGVVLGVIFLFPGLSSTYFSEDGKYIFFGGRGFSIYRFDTEDIYSDPILILNQKTNLKYTCCDWISSKFLATGSVEGVINLYRFDNHKISHSIVLAGCTGSVISIFFGEHEDGDKDATQIYCADSDGNFFIWKYSIDRRKWEVLKKHHFDFEVTSCDINFKKKYLVFGTKSGSYHMFSLPKLKNKGEFEEEEEDGEEDFENLSELKFSDDSVTTVTLNPNGNLIAAGCKFSNQLLVWDHSGESYVLKQQGHVSPVSVLAYSPNGDILASGDDEGKIKIWNMRTGQNFVTLETNKSKITGMKFSRPPGSRDPALFVSSADGTCRAYDVIRYRNFQTFVSPSRTGFNCMSINPSGEIIAAAGEGDFKIYLWNVKTRQLLDTLSSHSGPVTHLEFTKRGVLTSSSWDGTAKLWDVFSSKKKHKPQTLDHSHELITHAVREDGDEMAASTAMGSIYFWDIRTAEPNGVMDCRRDIEVRAGMGEMGTRLKEASKKYFTHIQYSTDGKRVIAGSVHCSYMFLYSVSHRVLLRRILFGTNLSVSGSVDLLTPFYTGRLKEQQKLYSRYVHLRGRSGKAQASQSSDGGGPGGRGFGKGKAVGDQYVPGSERELLRKVGCASIAFSPTQRTFCVGTAESIFVYSTSSHSLSTDSWRRNLFRPLDLDPSISPTSIYVHMKSKEYLSATSSAVRLGEGKILRRVIQAVPARAIPEVARGLAYRYIPSVLNALAKELEERGKQIEKYLLWLKYILVMRGEEMSEEISLSSSSLDKDENFAGSTQILGSLRFVIRGLRSSTCGIEGIRKICAENIALLSFLCDFENEKRNILEEGESKKKRRKIERKNMKKIEN